VVVEILKYVNNSLLIVMD